MPTSFGQRLYELRTVHRYSLRTLEELLRAELGDTNADYSVSHTAIRKWENPKAGDKEYRPHRPVLAALSRIFNCKPDFLMEGELDQNLPKSKDRLQSYQDVYLLTKEQNDVLLAMKKIMLENNLTSKTPSADSK